jgi:alkylated DNA repair dioxygenase AlkB
MATAETFLGDRLLVQRAYVEPEVAWAHFARLRDEIAWQQPGYAHERGVTRLPRLTANYGERSYDYGKLAFAPVPWTPLLRELRQLAEREGGVAFNAAIIQQYRDGADRVNWHADDSPLVGRDPVIVSLSFGATRTFQFKAKADPTDRLVLTLAHGDLAIMRGDLQHTHLHSVPKQPGAGPRINITFRRIVD